MHGQVHLVVLGAERTGSNLLVGLIDSHPHAYVGGELFNPRIVESRHVPWRPSGTENDSERLNSLREKDPRAFLEEAFHLGHAAGNVVVGFKLFYYHAVRFPHALEFVQQDPLVRVVHIKRRNRLARLASIIRAENSDIWGVESGKKVPEPQAISIPPERLVDNFNETERRELEYSELLAMHPMHEVFYEDLAADPRGVAHEVLAFLGLSPGFELEIRYQKTGTTPLNESISNYAQLKAEFGDIYTYFG